jgi:hypothetical protein
VKHSGSKLEAYQDSFEGLNTALRMFTKLRGLPAARTRFPPAQLDKHITFCAEMAEKAQACDVSNQKVAHSLNPESLGFDSLLAMLSQCHCTLHDMGT